MTWVIVIWSVPMAIWILGFLVFSLIWFMSRPKGRVCPACGENVRKGLTVSPNCQYDFAKAVSHEPPPAATS